jgi:asparagine synthase (glutamine-hydrolysing)
MCGIAGIVSTNSNRLETLELMVNRLQHRGPDGNGFFYEKNVAFGHRRLSIIDVSDASSQPMLDNSGRYVIVFNGEVYNFKAIKAKLLDYSFQTTGDTEVVLAAYIQWGENCVEYLNGMFAFSIYDREKEELFFARDRLGQKPFYYFHADESFLFSSELRSLLSSGLIPRKVSLDGIKDYLSYQAVNAPFTIIENVFQLKPGHKGFLRNGIITVMPYWKLTDKKEIPIHSNYSTVLKNTAQYFDKAVQDCMVSDVPIGAFLSGGIDSSAIVAIMAKHSVSPINTFSITFQESDYDESFYSDIIAKKFKTNQQSLLLKPNTLLEDYLTDALKSMDSPSGDGINTYMISKIVSNTGIKVALSGLGGDELFAGYSTFKKYSDFRKIAKYLKYIPSSLRGNLSNVFSNQRNREQIKAILDQENLESLSGVYSNFRRVFYPKEISDLTEVGKNIIIDRVKDELLIEDRSIGQFPILSQFSIGELSSYTSNLLLMDSDQMSMANSLELRVPFFDHDLVEYILSVEDRFKFSSKIPKSLLVESLEGLLPNEIVNRPKKGFSFPWEKWLKNELQQFCAEKLQNLGNRPYFDNDAISELWCKFLKGDSYILPSKIWLLVVLETWLSDNDLT